MIKTGLDIFASSSQIPLQFVTSQFSMHQIASSTRKNYLCCYRNSFKIIWMCFSPLQWKCGRSKCIYILCTIINKVRYKFSNLEDFEDTGKIWKLIATKKEIRDCFVISTILLLAGAWGGFADSCDF